MTYIPPTQEQLDAKHIPVTTRFRQPDYPGIVKCCECIYWTGNPGNMQDDLVCPVNTPKISNIELEAADGRTAYALHSCEDWTKRSN